MSVNPFQHGPVVTCCARESQSFGLCELANDDSPSFLSFAGCTRQIQANNYYLCALQTLGDHSMKKLLLTLPLLAGASWAGTTYYSGAQSEPAYNRFLEQLNSTGIFIVKSIEYEAGFTNSTAVTEVRLSHEDRSDILFRLNHKINHSPVNVDPNNARLGAANIVTTLVTDKIDNEDAIKIIQSFDTGEPFVMNTDVAIDGTTTSKIIVNAFIYNDADIAITTDESNINFTTTPDGAVLGNALIGSISATDQGSQGFSLTESKLNFDYEKIDDVIFNMKFDLNVETVLVTDLSLNDQELFRLEEADFGLDLNLSDKKPYIRQSAGIANLISDFVPLQFLDLNTEFAGFSIDYILENKDIFKRLTKKDDLDAWLKTEEFASTMRYTVVPETSFSINANAKTTDGDADAAIKLWFAGNGTADGYTGMATTGDLAKAVAGTSTFYADRSVLMNTPLGKMLDDPIAQIYLKITDETVSVDAKLQNLLLTLNEQILPLELMAGKMLQLPLETLLEH